MSLEPNSWPFDQPPNCATFTTQPVIDGLEAIVAVYHDAEDHGWQFIGSTGGSSENCLLVGLKEIVALDCTVLEVADLPPGSFAVRERWGAPWMRGISHDS